MAERYPYLPWPTAYVGSKLKNVLGIRKHGNEIFRVKRRHHGNSGSGRTQIHFAFDIQGVLLTHVFQTEDVDVDNIQPLLADWDRVSARNARYLEEHNMVSRACSITEEFLHLRR
jgi:hypothetical protein